MNVMDLRAAARALPPREKRPAMALAVETPDVRIALFKLEPGQAVPPHTNGSVVLINVLEGEGWLLGDGGERFCREGETVAYAPGERHAMRAGEQPLLLAATIIPGRTPFVSPVD